VNEAERWVEFGKYLREQRDRIGISRREAAKRSKVPEATWRDLEQGRGTNSYGGVRVLPNPGGEVLEKMATALEISNEDLMRHVGRLTNQKRASSSGAAKTNASPLAQKVGRLGDRDRRLVESLVDQMLELD
jgi:transcriptional regulator with XRE-family HTH domain